MRSLMTGTAGAALAGAGTTLVVCAMIIWAYDPGPQTRHMILHIVSMNVVAPVLAAFIATRGGLINVRVSLFWTAAILQIVLLWVWHAPAVYNAITDLPAMQFALHVLLLLAALLFWTSLVTLSGARRWQAIPALLVTAKLVCLLAALLIFAPRALYGTAGHAAHLTERLPGWHALDDQHLAGLLMIAACPLSYLVPAVIIAVQLIRPRETAGATL